MKAGESSSWNAPEPITGIGETRIRFRRRAADLALFLIPVAYSGGMFATAVHEVLGHGLFALAAGGSFQGFSLHWDAMGWAHAFPPPGATPLQEIFVLSGGIIATTLAGSVLLLLVLMSDCGPPVRLVLIAAAYYSFMDGFPYLLWNAIQPSPPGDVGRILEVCERHAILVPVVLRWVLGAAGGVLTIGATIGMAPLLYRVIEDYLGEGAPLTGIRRAAVLIEFIGMPGALGWYLFDWDQLAPGIGALPGHAGAAAVLSSIAILFLFPRRRSFPPTATRISALEICLPWAALAALLSAILFWLEKGVLWGKS